MDNSYKIILIAPKYFSYNIIIINALEKLGNKVDFLEDKNSGLLYNLSRKSSFLKKRYLAKYKKDVLDKLNSGDYQILIVIGGKTLDAEFWKYINRTYSFKKILYQWDSLKNFDYRDMIASFDVVKTFDSEDAKELDIPYLPLFYKKEVRVGTSQDLDMMFIGIWHSDRIDILNKIADYAMQNKLSYVFKVYHPWYIYLYMVYVRKSLKKSSFFIHTPISIVDTMNYYDRAKCIVDINHPGQSGLTMRTIEAIGKGKKLLTTNSFIKKEKFYDPQMIQVINRKDIKIKDDFFEYYNDYKNIDKLEIDNWVVELLS